jgi:hypothetical protein
MRDGGVSIYVLSQPLGENEENHGNLRISDNADGILTGFLTNLITERSVALISSIVESKYTDALAMWKEIRIDTNALHLRQLLRRNCETG